MDYLLKRQRTILIIGLIFLVICISLIFVSLLNIGKKPFNGLGFGHHDSLEYVSYSGPILPMTFIDSDTDITTERNVTFDFRDSNGGNRTERISVTDKYVINNSSQGDKQVTCLYPYISNMRDMYQESPKFLVNGTEVDNMFYMGGYTSYFTEVDSNTNIYNIDKLKSYSEYKKLLSDGSYLNKVFIEKKMMDIPVTVYRFLDSSAPSNYPAATNTISFTIDEDKTTILSYGFNGSSRNNVGDRSYSYSVPDTDISKQEMKVLIVIGEDITEYKLNGSKQVSTDNTNRMDGVNYNVTKETMYLSEILGSVIQNYLTLEALYSSIYYGATTTPVEIPQPPTEYYLGEVMDQLHTNGVLSVNNKEHYLSDRLQDIITEVATTDRVIYLSSDITIPPKEDITIEFVLSKKASLDYSVGNEGDAGIVGYDLATYLGSNMIINHMAAEILHTDNIELVRQNYGFDLEQGIDQVDLSTNIERYYMDVRITSIQEGE